MFDDRQIAVGVVSILLGIGLLAGLWAFMRRAGRGEENTGRRDKWAAHKGTYTDARWNKPGVTVLVLFIAFSVWLSLTSPHPTPPTAEEIQREKERKAKAADESSQREYYKRSLCIEAAACKKYDKMRLECATAGDFKKCLRIKMGSDVVYSERCSGFIEGAPALPPPPETPNAVDCFFRTLVR